MGWSIEDALVFRERLKHVKVNGERLTLAEVHTRYAAKGVTYDRFYRRFVRFNWHLKDALKILPYTGNRKRMKDFG